MESPSQVAVSLDELTLDLSDDIGLESEGNSEYIPHDNDKKASPLTPRKTTDTPFVNLNFIFEDTPQECPAGNFKEQFDLKPENETEETENEKFNGDEIHFAPISTITSLEQKDNFETEPEDFEVDVPPLSLFLSQRNDESDDSEFEFPEPDQANQTSFQSDAIVEHNQSITTKETTVYREEGNFHDNELREKLDVQLNSACGTDLQPEILTPREKVTSDLPAALLLQESLTNENEKTQQLGEIKEKYENSSTFSSSTQERQIEINKTGDSDKDNFSKPSIVTTAEDWEGIQIVEPGFADPSQKRIGAAPVIESKPLATYSDSWQEMAGMDYSDVKNNVKSQVERRGFSALTHLLFGPPKLHKDLLPERELVFCIAGTQFDNDKDIHNRILQTIYRSLTGSKFDCQRFGGHWEEIGFQGRDPATDLRGTGMLALLHILFFLRDPQTKALARDIYKLSLHPTQNFPFCVMSINVTRICLQVVREDVYNKECNKKKDVMGTVNQIYAALFLQLFMLWKKGKTIADSGFVLQEIESYSRKHSKNVFKDLESYDKRIKQETLFGGQPENNPSFLDVCKEDKFDNKSTAELY